MAQDPSLNLVREKAKIEKEIAAIKKKAQKEERAHNDTELKKLEEYRKRKRQIAKEQAKEEERQITRENQKYGLKSLQTELDEKVMRVSKKLGKQQKYLTQEYYKQGLHLHGFLEDSLRFSSQVVGLNKNIAIGTDMFDSQSKVIRRFAPDFTNLVDSQKASLDLSQSIGKSYDEMGKGSFQDLTKEAEEQLKIAKNQKTFIDDVATVKLQAQADTLHGNSKEKKEILARIKEMKSAANFGVRTAKNNESQAKKLKAIHQQTAAAADLILDPFQKLQGVLESTKMGKLASEIIGVDDVISTFSDRLTTDLSNALDDSNNMNFGLAFSNMKVYGQQAMDSLSEGFKMLTSGARQFAAAAMANPYVAVAAAIALIGVLLYKAMSYAEEMRKEFGVTRGEAFEIQLAVDATSKQFKMLGVSAEDVGTLAQGIADSMGGVNNITKENLDSMANLTALYGMSADSIAPAMTAMKALGAESNEAASAQLAQIGHMAQLEGVAPAKVFADITANMATFSRFGQEGGKNLAKASIMARKLGTSLESMAATSDALLDFESSINDQMEASMLTGRAINMDKARELALAGDIAGQEREILKQIGTQAEFEKMNVVQRDALAKATGKSTEDLAAMLANQANLTAMTASERAEKERMQKADERVNKGMKEMGSMLSEVFSEMMKPLKEVMIALGPTLGVILKVLGKSLKIVFMPLMILLKILNPIIKVLGTMISIIFSIGDAIANALLYPIQLFMEAVKAGALMLFNIFKIPFNFIIAGINAMINGINALSVKVPDWVPLIGGNTLGFNIPTIPSLATKEGGPGHNVTKTGVAEVHKGESVGTFDMSKVEGKLDEVITLLSEGAPMVEGIHGIKKNTGEFSDSIATS